MTYAVVTYCIFLLHLVYYFTLLLLLNGCVINYIYNVAFYAN